MGEGGGGRREEGGESASPQDTHMDMKVSTKVNIGVLVVVVVVGY